MAVADQGCKLANIAKCLQPLVLVGAQQCDDGAPIGDEAGQKLSSHAFTIHNDAGVCLFPPSLFITSQHLGQSHRQMLVSTRGRGPARMSLLIMKQHQRTPSQDFAGASDESTRDQAIGIHGLAVPIDVKTGSRFRKRILVLGFPQMGRPEAKGGGQRFGSIRLRQLAQKPLSVAIAISPRSPRHHCQRVSGIAAQVMRSMQSAQRKE